MGGERQRFEGLKGQERERGRLEEKEKGRERERARAVGGWDVAGEHLEHGWPVGGLIGGER
jgi:hypothetical protein